MGREFKPGRWVLLLDFDNKVEGDSRNGLELISKLKMDQYNAPCQTTPSGGYHYLFFVDAEQKDQITSKTTITHEGVKYDMDVKFKNSLCNCAPTKLEGYGACKWVKPGRLRDIPKLPNELYDMIKNKARPERHGEKKDSHNENLDSQSGNLDRGYLKGFGSTQKTTEDELHDVRALCSCLSLAQLDNYATWVRVGMILKKIGAPCSLWEQVSQRSNKFKNGDCTKRWSGLQPELFSIGSLFVLAKDGNLDMHERVRPTLKAHKRVFDDSGAYPVVEINTPFLTPKSPADPPNTDQAKFQQLTDEVMDTPGKKALVVRSRYGSGKTTFLQRLVKARNPKRILFITYRQTLARDIMRNFGKLGLRTT